MILNFNKDENQFIAFKVLLRGIILEGLMFLKFRPIKQVFRKYN